MQGASVTCLLQPGEVVQPALELSRPGGGSPATLDFLLCASEPVPNTLNLSPHVGVLTIRL